MYYVYLHIRESDNKIFYVGKGKNNRAWVKSNRSEYWKRIVNKHGYKVEILFENLSEEEANQCEKDAIAELRYLGYPLCNFTDGGPGISGYKITDIHKKKISESQKRTPKTERQLQNLRVLDGKVRSEKHRLNLSKSLQGRVQSKEEIEKRKNTLKRLDHKSDKNKYLFFNDSDVFFGTRKELSEKYQIKRTHLRNLFASKPCKHVRGWSVLTGVQLQILKTLIKGI